MAKYKLKFMFDWGSGSCLWSINDAANKLYGYSVSTEQLPISSELKDTLNELINTHDEALDWNCPQNGLLWSEEQIQSFMTAAVAAYEKLSLELGQEYDIALWDNCLI